MWANAILGASFMTERLGVLGAADRADSTLRVAKGQTVLAIRIFSKKSCRLEM
jgi:hypothetical protein